MCICHRRPEAAEHTFHQQVDQGQLTSALFSLSSLSDGQSCWEISLAWLPLFDSSLTASLWEPSDQRQATVPRGVSQAVACGLPSAADRS